MDLKTATEIKPKINEFKYVTNNSNYGATWKSFSNDRPVVKQEVPTLSNIEKTKEHFHQTAKEALRQAEGDQTEYRTKLKETYNNPQIFLAKKFPVKPEEYKYPEHGLNIGNPLYMTSNMDYGRLKPSGFEVPEKFFPRDISFTNSYGGSNFMFNGLNTASTFSNVHKLLDEF